VTNEASSLLPFPVTAGNGSETRTYDIKLGTTASVRSLTLSLNCVATTRAGRAMLRSDVRRRL